jgi:DNA-binding NtrC family response regulator
MGAMTPELRTIMIVDDDAAIRETWVDYLASEHGFTLSLAETPDEAGTVINTRDGCVRVDAAQTRADMAVTRADGLREAITVLEVKLAKAEAVSDAARKRAHELANRVLILQGADDRVAGLRDLLADAECRAADAERRAADAEDARETALTHADAMERADAERRGRGLPARLRDAWRGR